MFRCWVDIGANCQSKAWLDIYKLQVSVGLRSFRLRPGAFFSKVPKLFGSISGATIPVISSQRQWSKPLNFAVLLVFLTLKACLKISCPKQADCSFTSGFSCPKSSRDFRKTGPWPELLEAWLALTNANVNYHRNVEVTLP